MANKLPIELERSLATQRGPGLFITRNNLNVYAALQAASPGVEWEILTKDTTRGWGIRRFSAFLRKRSWTVVILEDHAADLRRREDLYVLILLLARAKFRWLLGSTSTAVDARFLPWVRGWMQTVAALVAESWSSARAIVYGYGLVRKWKSARPGGVKAPPGNRRIAMLRPQFWFDVKAGGSVTHIRGVASGMRDLGLEPHLWITSRLPVSERELSQSEIPPGRRPSLFEDAAMVAFNRVVLRHMRGAFAKMPPALVYQRHDIFSLAGLILARLYRIPLVLEVNASEVWAREAWSRLFLKGLSRKMERLMFQNADRLVLITEELIPTVISLGGSLERIVVNPNGVDVRRFNPDPSNVSAKRELGFPPEAILCGFVGTFARWHGVLFLAEQISVLLSEDPRLHFLLLGEGDMRPEVESRLSEAGASDRVTFPGLVASEAVPSYLSACDILLSPHLPFEDGTAFFGSPTKLFEYMAAGRAIVASRLGSIARILSDDETGLLVDPGDGPAFRAAVLDLANDAEKRRRLGKSARRSAELHYTWTANARRALEGLVELTPIEIA